MEAVKNPVFGLVFSCAAIPGTYAALAYFGVAGGAVRSVPPEMAARAAFLLALPLILSGAVQWWDTWVSPCPKVGGTWQPVPPEELVLERCRNHAILIGVVVATAVAANAFRLETDDPAGSESQLKGELSGLEEAQQRHREREAEEGRAWQEKLEAINDAQDKGVLKEGERETFEAEREKWADAMRAEKKELDGRAEALNRRKELHSSGGPIPHIPLCILAFGVFLNCINIDGKPGVHSGKGIQDET